MAPPGTHETLQAREPKPKTGGSRAQGGPYRGTSPASNTETGTVNNTHTTLNTQRVEECKGAFTMKELAGELRWIMHKDKALELRMLVEARKMEDLYYNQKESKARRREYNASSTAMDDAKEHEVRLEDVQVGQQVVQDERNDAKEHTEKLEDVQKGQQERVHEGQQEVQNEMVEEWTNERKVGLVVKSQN